MPSRAEIVSFDDSPPPPGADPWVPGAVPAIGIEVTDPDPDWPRQDADLAGLLTPGALMGGGTVALGAGGRTRTLSGSSPDLTSSGVLATPESWGLMAFGPLTGGSRSRAVRDRRRGSSTVAPTVTSELTTI
jgi:hypothetical protein